MAPADAAVGHNRQMPAGREEEWVAPAALLPAEEAGLALGGSRAPTVFLADDTRPAAGAKQAEEEAGAAKQPSSPAASTTPRAQPAEEQQLGRNSSRHHSSLRPPARRRAVVWPFCGSLTIFSTALAAATPSRLDVTGRTVFAPSDDAFAELFASLGTTQARKGAAAARADHPCAE